MPLRHHKPTTINNLNFVLNMCTKYKNTNDLNHRVLMKFEKQTIRRLESLQDKEKALNALSILENEYRKTDETNIYHEKLIKLVDLFLHEYIFPSSNDNNNNSNEILNEKEIIERTLIISLSGGVDSMVLCKILNVLAKKYNHLQEYYATNNNNNNNMKKKNKKQHVRKKRKISTTLTTPKYKINVIALHVNYNNRVESIDEANYLQKWCKDHDIELLIESFTDIKRGITPRDVYEKETRNRRYQFYKDVLEHKYHNSNNNNNNNNNIGNGSSSTSSSNNNNNTTTTTTTTTANNNNNNNNILLLKKL